jgi:hypothetical protein
MDSTKKNDDPCDINQKNELKSVIS